MITRSDILNVYLARRIISASFAIKKYEPEKGKYEGILADYVNFLHTAKRGEVI